MIILLVALVLVFALTIAIGLRDDRDSGDSSLVDQLRRFQSDRFLVNENSQGCGDNETSITLAAGTCTITVERSGRFSAPVRAAVSVVSGIRVLVVVVPDSGPTQKQKVKGGDCSEAVFGRGGGTLSLACVSTTGCVVRLLRQSCPVEVPL